MEKLEVKLNYIQSEKHQPQNRSAEKQQDLDVKMMQMEKQVAGTQKELEFQNKSTYDIMHELVNQKEKMLNPIVTKFIQINALLYGKSYTNFSHIGAIDPNKNLINKMVEKSKDPVPLANIGAHRKGQSGPSEKQQAAVDRFTAKQMAIN